MHRNRPKPPRYRALYLLVVLACVGLGFAINYRSSRRTEIDGSRPKPEEEAEVLISTQVLSFRVDAPIELDVPEEPPKSILLSARPEKPNAPIIHTERSAKSTVGEETENMVLKKEYETLTRTNGPLRAEEIVVE